MRVTELVCCSAVKYPEMARLQGSAESMKRKRDRVSRRFTSEWRGGEAARGGGALNGEGR